MELAVPEAGGPDVGVLLGENSEDNGNTSTERPGQLALVRNSSSRPSTYLAIEIRNGHTAYVQPSTTLFGGDGRRCRFTRYHSVRRDGSVNGLAVEVCDLTTIEHFLPA
jgi:hypothetical protein